MTLDLKPQITSFKIVALIFLGEWKFMQLDNLDDSWFFSISCFLIINIIIIHDHVSCAGTIISGLLGGLCGATFGKEVATHWYQLYKYKPGEAQLRFLYWWEDKTAGHMSY